MISSEIYHLKTTLTRDGIWFCYVGSISDGVFSEVRSALKSRSHLPIAEQSLELPQKVFSIFLAQTRSMVQGNEMPDTSDKTNGTIMVYEKGGKPILMLGLTLPEVQVEQLRTKLNNLSSSEAPDSGSILVQQEDLFDVIANTRDSILIETKPMAGKMVFVSLSITI
jgi:hypothetical protein